MARQPSLRTICQRLARALEAGRVERAAELFAQFASAPPDKRSRLINQHYLVPAATLLHFAAESGNVQIAKSLLNLGADIEAADDREVTPLHTALWNEHEDVAHLLLKAGADCTGLGVAEQTSLHQAAVFGSGKLIRALVKAGAEVDARDQWNARTPLHMAAYVGRDQTLKALISAGATIEARKDDSGTPLLFAAIYGNLKTVKLLISAGADPNAKDDRKRSALHFAVRQRNYPMARLLIENGATYAHPDDLGQTPLQIALAFDDVKMIQSMGLEPAGVTRRRPRQPARDAICFTILLMNYTGSAEYDETSFVGQLHECMHWSPGACSILKDAVKALADRWADSPLPRELAYPAFEISEHILFSAACHWHVNDGFEIENISTDELLEEIAHFGNLFTYLMGGNQRRSTEISATDLPVITCPSNS